MFGRGLKIDLILYNEQLIGKCNFGEMGHLKVAVG